MRRIGWSAASRSPFSQAPAADNGPAPVTIIWNGLDSTKEHTWCSKRPASCVQGIVVMPPGRNGEL